MPTSRCDLRVLARRRTPGGLTMLLMAICGLLVLLGLIAVVRWGGVEIDGGSRLAAVDRPSPWAVVRRYLWSVALALVSGLGAGILVAGAGGRLAMRLLAVTAGPDARGRVTEADEVVGRITAGGTVSFVIFTALFFGAASGALYVLLRRWLPRGRMGGVTYGALLLVLAATRIDPLRAENPDFDLVGPGWLAFVVFALIVLVHGMLVAALAGRYSRNLPLLAGDRGSVVRNAPLFLLVLSPFVAVVVAAGGGLAVALSRLQPLVVRMRAHGTTVAGRLVLAALALVALPSFLSAVVDIMRGHP